jgi:hypothetical protein
LTAVVAKTESEVSNVVDDRIVAVSSKLFIPVEVVVGSQGVGWFQGM